MSMMERKQEEGFPKLFLAYFNASTTIQGNFINYARQPGQEDYVRVAMDAIIDVMDLSGLAFLFSELDGTHFEKIVECVWDLHFQRFTDKAAIVRALYASIDSKLSLPLFSPSAMQRQAWGRRLVRAMVDRGIIVDWHLDPSRGRRRARPHPSAVIESVLVSFGHPMQAPHEYFAAIYIARRVEANGIDLPRGVETCRKGIERARQRQVRFDIETE
ncbi:MAG: hypothetical protein A2Y95_12935 [Deltaproteobacteria bacterium RBG_13_65_10]|nr:MAG: hypothetical protein A2Y95_12935 [Deltaproteobacteria bacterium RBG_13_65_10]